MRVCGARVPKIGVKQQTFWRITVFSTIMRVPISRWCVEIVSTYEAFPDLTSFDQLPTGLILMPGCHILGT